jgi:hypothetical protein
MTLPDPSIVLLVDSTAPHREQGRYRPAEHGGSHAALQKGVDARGASAFARVFDAL